VTGRETTSDYANDTKTINAVRLKMASSTRTLSTQWLCFNTNHQMMIRAF
jgi:hypothetical protein